MDPDKAMDAATEGAKVLTKFQEIILKFMGPWNTRKQADADTYANEQKLKMIRDNPDMDIVFVGDEMHARERTPEAFAERAALRQSNENVRQQRNLENVLETTAIEMQSAEIISDIPVDEDWITRLFSIVKDVNSEEMQYLWGKILAGEIITPGSFSLRTLETVRNMSRTDAETFQRIFPFIINYKGIYFLPSNDDLNVNHGLHYSDILALDECGLVNSSGVSLHMMLSKNMEANCYTDERIMIIKSIDDTEKKITFGGYALSNVGKELYGILQHTTKNEYFLDFAEQIRKAHKASSVDISIHQINFIGDGTINYVLSPIKSFPKES